MPAQNSGAAYWGLMESGTGTAKSSWTLTYWAYPPRMPSPSVCESAHLCSLPARQCSHWRHVSSRGETPARCPFFSRVTSGPASTTVPTISWPGMVGSCGGMPRSFQSPSIP